MDPMAYDGETASPDAFSDDSSECPSGGGSNQLDNRLQVIIWLKEHYRVGDAGSMRKSFVYQHYLDACRESGMEGAPISHTFFGKLVRRAFPGIKCNRKGPRGDAHQCYTHLERLPTAQRLGAWQVEQITEELSKCSSSGSPTGSRLSPLRPKTSPRPRDTYHHHQNQEHDDEVPSTPISDDHAHHHHQPRRHPHPNQHAHQGGQCFSSCCSPLSSPPIAFSTSASTSSSFSSSPRSSCCPEGLEEGEFAPEEAPSCCGGHHHGHPHYHPSSSSSSSSSSSCDESYESYHPDEQLSLLPQQQQQQQPYLPDLAYAAPAFLSYPAFYGHPATYSSSYSPAAADHHAQQHQQFPLHHHHQQHQQYPQSASPTFGLSSTGSGEEEGEEEFGVGNVTALASPRLGNGMALTFADYLTACQTARLQQHPLHTSATIGEGEFETDRGEDAATAWSADGCSRAEPLAALSWASTAWSDAIY